MSSSDVAVIGAGFGGIGAAIRLGRRGYDVVVFERGDDVGGTWRDNTYPGCACDVPSHLYSFSFAPNPNWPETFSGQDEIWRYLRECVTRFGIADRLRFGAGVERAAWDAAANRWQLTMSSGQVHTARVLIVATGPLSEPSTPDIPGLDDFAGEVFHSAQWRHDLDLRGRKVAVIGTGASAVQFVPQIQPYVERLSVFQRTPPWIMPRRSRHVPAVERAVYRYVPGAHWLRRTLLYWARESFALGFTHPKVMQRAQRLAERHLEKHISDPALRARLTPTYLMGCKRVLLSNDYLPSLNESNVDVVTSSIATVRPDAVVTADGVEHPADTIIFGTGFHVTDSPMMQRVFGRDGQSLGQAWTPTMRAHRGTMVTGFPNLFFLLGPNTGLGHTSVILMIESQLHHIVALLDHQRRNGIEAVEPTVAAQRRWNSDVDTAMETTVWAQGGCVSWYLDATGRNSTLWPTYATAFRHRLRRFRPDDYTVVAPAPATVGVSG